MFLPLFLAIFTALVQAAGVVSIGPFLALVANPEKFRESTIGNILVTIFSEFSDFGLLVVTGVIFVSLTIVTNLLVLFSTYANSQLVWNVGHKTRERAFANYLNRDVDYHANSDSSAGMKLVVSDTAVFTTDVLAPCLNLISGIVTGVVLIGIMVMFSFGGTVLIGLTTISFYIFIFKISNGYTKKLRSTVAEGFEILYSEVKESIDNIAYVKFGGSESSHLNRFSTVSGRMKKVEPKLVSLSQLPKNVFEAVAVTLIVCIAIYSYGVKNSSVADIPMFGILLFAMYRLMPICQRVYASAIRMQSYFYAATAVHEIVFEREGRELTNTGNVERISFKNEIEFSNVSFSRTPDRPVFSNVCFSINKNEIVGIYGHSGSGKSTLIKLLTMLYQPDSGEVLVDGIKLDSSNAARWRLSIGYVPQDVGLKYGTIAENIGYEMGEIDMDRVASCCELAGLSEFIEVELSEGYRTITGDGDTRFSGGQKQRIGIARALYREPDLLILDESTSALDQTTEQMVLRNIRESAMSLTVVLVTHDMACFESTDKLLNIERGFVSVVSRQID